MRAIRISRTIDVQRLAASHARFLGTTAGLGGLSAAEIGKLAVNGIRPSEMKPEKVYTTLPKVEEVLVHVTLVDFKGDQYKIVGRVGDSLM